MTLAAELPMMSVISPHHTAAAAAAAVAAAAAAVANSNSNSSHTSKSKLGFSIDSIVGNESTHSKLRDSLNMSPTDLTTKVNHTRSRSRSRSPPRSKSTSPATSPPPSSEGSSAPLVRPIPHSFPGGISPQTYLDQLAHLKAIYEQHQNAQQNQIHGSPGSPNSTPTSPPATSTTPTTSLGGSAGPTTSTASIGPPPPHGLPHAGPMPFPPGFAFPRPGGLPGLPGGLPGSPLLFGAGGPPGQIPPQIPREYPLYPWFISRRFPGGK